MPVMEDTTQTFRQVPWQEFLSQMQWSPGEHVTMIGPTGQGKTTLARELVNRRKWVMVLATKKRDSTLDLFSGYRTTTTPQYWMGRTIVRPPFPRDPDKLFSMHRTVFRRALVSAYQSGGWTVLADEVRYLTQQLNLTKELELLWLQGRSLGVSLVAATQRPRHIPLTAYDQATHLFFWRDTDMGNVKRISEIGGSVDRRAIQTRVPQLPKYHFLYVNTRTDNILESKVEM